MPLRPPPPPPPPSVHPAGAPAGPPAVQPGRTLAMGCLPAPPVRACRRSRAPHRAAIWVPLVTPLAQLGVPGVRQLPGNYDERPHRGQHQAIPAIHCMCKDPRSARDQQPAYLNAVEPAKAQAIAAPAICSSVAVAPGMALGVTAPPSCIAVSAVAAMSRTP